MDNLERLHCLKCELIKLVLNKSQSKEEWQKLRTNIILTNELIELDRTKQNINDEKIVSVENYIKSRRS